MKVLRSHALPKQLTAFRSLQYDLQAGLDCRTMLLARAKGYPTPGHVIARAQSLLNLSSIQELKEGILKLRDVAQYASEILMTIPQLKVERHLLRTSEVQSYISDNKEDYGYSHLSDEDVKLASYFILSSEMLEAAWMLDQHPQTEMNRITIFHKLYHSLRGSRLSDVEVVKGGAGYKPKFSSMPSVYLTDTNKIGSLNDLSSVSRIMRGIVADKSGDAGDLITRALKREDTILRIADLRLIDHVFCLLMSPDVWNLFIPHRAKSDPAHNEERAKGLELLAGYLHSLLLIPHFLRTELFKQGYEQYESWLGNMPFIPADIQRNYAEIVSKYDVLGIAEEVKGMYSKADNKGDKMVDSDIHVFFTEFAHLYNIDEAYAKADAASVKDTKILFSDLQLLRDNKYNHILLSHPLGKFDMSRDIQQAVLDSEVYRHTMNDAFSMITHGVGKYLQESVISRINSAGFRVPFDMHQALPVTPNHSQASGAVLDGNKYQHRYFSMSYNYDTEYRLNHEFLYSVTNSRSLVSKFPSNVCIDRGTAAKTRVLVGREWKSLYPSSLVMGDRSIELSVLRNSKREMEQLFEYLSGQHFELIRRNLFSPYTREIWATALSSFALLLLKDTAGVGVEKKEAKNPLSVGSGLSYQMVPGFGMPYGKTYEDLMRIQKFTNDDVIDLTDEVAIVLLNRYPMPESNLAITQLAHNRQYYYCPGNGSHVEIKRLCYDDSMLHYHLRPVDSMIDAITVFFDKIYAYNNDALVLQPDIAMKLQNNSEEKYGWSIPFSDKDWQLKKNVAFVEYAALPPYGKVTAVISPSDAPAESVTKLVTEMEKSIKKAEADTVVATEEDTKAQLEVSIPTLGKTGSAPAPKREKKKTEGKKEDEGADDSQE